MHFSSHSLSTLVARRHDNRTMSSFVICLIFSYWSLIFTSPFIHCSFLLASIFYFLWLLFCFAYIYISIYLSFSFYLSRIQAKIVSEHSTTASSRSLTTSFCRLLEGRQISEGFYVPHLILGVNWNEERAMHIHVYIYIYTHTIRLLRTILTEAIVLFVCAIQVHFAEWCMINEPK